MKTLSVFGEAKYFLLDNLPLVPQYTLKALLNGVLTLGIIRSFRIVKKNIKFR